MKSNRTTIAAALCCMALTSGAALAEGTSTTNRGMDNSASPSTMNRGMDNTNSPSSMNRGGMNSPGYGHAGAMNHQTVRQVQQALANKGHDPGPVDGIMGPRTRAALQDYQRAENLSASSGLDSRTLESLGVQANASGDSGASAGGVGNSYGGAGGMTTPRTGSDAAVGGSTPPSGMNNNQDSNPTGTGTGTPR